MEEHTVDLLRECDSGCAMAAESLEQIRDFVSDQGLWNEITASYEKHQDLDLRIKKTLRAMEEQGKEPGKMGIRLVLDVHRNEDDGKRRRQRSRQYCH